MFATIQAGHLPFTPWVMSWLSVKLDKRSTSITAEDVESVIAQAPHAATA